jgi:hypothetical protein
MSGGLQTKYIIPEEYFLKYSVPLFQKKAYIATGNK